MYDVVLSKSFDKELRKEIKRNRKLWLRVTKTLKLLNSNIKHKSLKLHKLSGTEYWSVSVDAGYRMIIKIEDKSIICIKFGTHEEVY